MDKIARASEVSPSEGSRGASEDNDRALVVRPSERESGFLASFAPASLELTHTYIQKHAHKHRVTHRHTYA